MLRCEEYVRTEDLDTALSLGRAADVQYIAGGTLSRLYDRQCRLVVDILPLLDDGIKKTGDELVLGAGCSLRALECSAVITQSDLGILREAVRHLGGVALRNMITLGGTIASRLGSSELITTLVALQASVVLHGIGKVSLDEYLQGGFLNEIITELRIPLRSRHYSLESMRNGFTDMSLLHVAVVRDAADLLIVAGSRPGRAAVARRASRLYKEQPEIPGKELVATALQELFFGSDLRADAWYRKKVFPVLLERALKEVGV